MTTKTDAPTPTVDLALVSELKAGHELIGELLAKMMTAQAAAVGYPAPEAPHPLAAGSGVRAAAPARVARGTTPPPVAPPAPAPPQGTGRGRANLSDPRLKGVKELTREFNGWKITVHVLPDGFEWGGKVWSSLSAIAKAVTGSSRNGYEFFGLAERR